MMVTDLGEAFGEVLFKQRMTRSQVCEIFKITSGSLSRLLHKTMPTQQLVEILDTLGYDVKVCFVPKGSTNPRQGQNLPLETENNI